MRIGLFAGVTTRAWRPGNAEKLVRGVRPMNRISFASAVAKRLRGANRSNESGGNAVVGRRESV